MAVYLTVGRVALNEPASSFPISPEGVAETCALYPLLEKQSKCPDVIFSSEDPRALATARIVSRMSECKKLFPDRRLNMENGLDKQQQRSLYREIVFLAKENGWKHVHVVTFVENISTLLYRDIRDMPDVPYSHWVVRQAENWDNMLGTELFSVVDVPPRQRATVLQLVALNRDNLRRQAKVRSGIWDDEDYKRTLSLGYRVLELKKRPLDYEEIVSELVGDVLNAW